MSGHSTPPAAYSYVRFSSKAQAGGDSFRRQTEKAEAYCKRRGWKLDASLNLYDLGVSAFRGKNALVGNLRLFLDELKRGTVRPGSALIVESIDRISRQGIDEGYDIIKGILKAGVLLVTLSPEREFGVEAVKSLSKGALEIQLILERAAEESERKSERVSHARAQERKRIREKQEIVTRRLPAWLEARGRKAQLIRGPAAAVRQVFKLAVSGYGIPTIVKKLTHNKVPPIGRNGHWTCSYVALLLRDRRVRGEYQPHRGKVKEGEVVTGYYPAVVSEDEWQQARAAIGERRRHSGRNGHSQRVNIFAGILKHARDGDNYMMTQRLSRMRGKTLRQFSVLVNAKADKGQARSYSMPYDVFENAILELLLEIDPHEILNGDRPADETATLAAELVGVEAELAEAAAFMEAHGFSATIGKRIAALEAKKANLAEKLAEARLLAAHPLSESWGEAQSLAEALATAPDPQDARLRLRSALRRIVESMWLLVVPRGRDRLAAVQMWFGKRQRDYLIFHRPASYHREAKTTVHSETFGVKPGDLDLRRRDQAARLERWLLETALP
jgi:DNA invertase Pin-like site-specific DNA recombinase